MRYVSTNRSSLRLFARTHRQLSGLECQECELLSGVGGRVEESLTDPGQLSASGSRQVWHYKPWEIIYLEPPYSAWLYFSTLFGGTEGALGGWAAWLHCCIAKARRKLKNWSLTGASHFVGLHLHKRFLGLEKAEVVRAGRDSISIFACCHHVNTFIVLLLQQKKKLNNWVLCPCSGSGCQAGHCTFSNFNSTNNKDIFYAQASLCLQESTLARGDPQPCNFDPFSAEISAL